MTAGEMDSVEGKSDVVALWKMARQSHAHMEEDSAAERVIPSTVNPIEVCLLTGGDDRPYSLGMASTLASRAISVDFIASDKLDAPELHRTPLLIFLNLRGDLKQDASLGSKFVRISAYYARLAKQGMHSPSRKSFISSAITNSSSFNEPC
jgi:hypothetical protein